MDKFIFAAFTRFFNTGSILLAVIYANTLFLTNYPAKFIPYFALATGITLMITSYLVKPLLRNDYRRKLIFLVFGAIALLVCCFHFIKYNITVMPFVLAVAVLIIPRILSVFYMSAVTSSFSLQEYKTKTSWFSMADNLGSLSAGLFPLLLGKASTQNLYFILLGYMFVLVFFLQKLTPYYREETQDNSKKLPSPLKYSLFTTCLAIALVGLFCFAITDYCTKTIISQTLNAQQISQFLGIIYTIGNAGAFILQLFVTKKIIKNYGPTVLLLAAPVITIPLAILAGISPSVWTFGILFAVTEIIQYGISSTGRDVVLNILPRPIYNLGRLLMNGTFIPAINLLSAGFLAISVYWLGIQQLIIVIIIGGVISIWLNRRLAREYKKALESAVKQRRFGLLNTDETLPGTDKLVQEMLQQKNPEMIRFGLSLLPNIQTAQLTTVLFPLLDNPHADIRQAAITYIQQYPEPIAVKKIIERAYIEDTPEVLATTLNFLALHAPLDAYLFAKRHLQDSDTSVRSAAMSIIIVKGNLQDITDMFNQLQILVKDNEQKNRLIVPNVMAKLPIGQFDKELKALLKDGDKAIQLAVLQCVVERRDKQLLLLLIDQLLAHRQTMYITAKHVAAYGENIIPYLLGRITPTQSKNRVFGIIRTISLIPGVAAEKALYVIYENSVDRIANRMVVKQLLYRAQKYPVIKSLQEFAEQQFYAEFKLYLLLMKELPLQVIPAIYTEVEARLTFTKELIFYWFTLSANPVMLTPLLPVLMVKADDQNKQLNRDKALELLDVYVKNKTVVEMMTALTKDNIQADSSIWRKLPETIAQDLWIETIAKEAHMEDIQKMFTLRQSTLFSELAGEDLLEIAHECKMLEIVQGQQIFSEGAAPDGLYIIVSGEINITKKGEIKNTLKNNQFFGELALIDSAPRAATAIAATDGIVIFLSKAVFDRVTEDLPEVLRAVTQVIMSYLRGYIQKEADVS